MTIVHGPEGSGKHWGNDSYFRLVLSKVFSRQNTLTNGNYQNEVVSLPKKIEHEDFPSKGKSSSFYLWILCWRSKRGCQSVTIRETTANKVTKHVVPAFVHSLIRWRLRNGSKHCFYRPSKVFLRSSLAEWVVLATRQPIICYCFWGERSVITRLSPWLGLISSSVECLKRSGAGILLLNES